MLEKEKFAQDCADYIEAHLKENLSLDVLAAEAGYSIYHFLRKFKVCFGISAMEYVKRRRLFAASREIENGRRILDTALDYGWQTHSGFTRAFQSLYGYSPALLRALYVRQMSMKGEGNMGFYLKNMEVHTKPEVLYQELLKTMREEGTLEHEERILKIYQLAAKFHSGEMRKSGEPYITHPLNTAILLADMGADETTICAGLLHDVPYDQETLKEIRETATEETVKIVEGFHNFDVDYCNDERVVLLALAERLHNMRTIEFIDPKTWKERAEITLNQFVSIANKCENRKVQLELEELAERYLV